MPLNFHEKNTLQKTYVTWVMTTFNDCAMFGAITLSRQPPTVHDHIILPDSLSSVEGHIARSARPHDCILLL